VTSPPGADEGVRGWEKRRSAVLRPQGCQSAPPCDEGHWLSARSGVRAPAHSEERRRLGASPPAAPKRWRAREQLPTIRAGLRGGGSTGVPLVGTLTCLFERLGRPLRASGRSSLMKGDLPTYITRPRPISGRGRGTGEARRGGGRTEEGGQRIDKEETARARHPPPDPRAAWTMAVSGPWQAILRDGPRLPADETKILGRARARMQ